MNKQSAVHARPYEARHASIDLAGSAQRSKLPTNVEPLAAEVLDARRAIILTRRRERKIAKPLYVNTDASWRDGIAGIAYASDSLGNRTYVVACGGSTEAEYLALLMAMQDADRVKLSRPIEFRVDCAAVVELHTGMTRELVKARKQIMAIQLRHRRWRLVQVERRSNKVANLMARRALNKWRDF